MKRSLVRIGPICFVLAVIGCGGSNSTAPTARVAGNYAATQFVTTGTAGQTNQILAGSTLYLFLETNGSLFGRLHMAGSGDTDMTGTWTQTGNTISFSQTADTFVRNMTFTALPNGNSWQLVGDQVVSGTRIQLTLGQINELP
jgi:hypothetical protein